MRLDGLSLPSGVGLQGGVGGISLVEFRNIHSGSLPDGSVEYRAQVTYQWSTNIFTYATVEDVHNNWNRQQHKRRWLATFTYPNELARTGDEGVDWFKHEYFVNYYDYGWSSINSYHYAGDLSFKLEFDPIWPNVKVDLTDSESGEVVDNVDLITTFRWGNVEVVEKDYSSKPIEKHQDFFHDNNPDFTPISIDKWGKSSLGGGRIGSMFGNDVGGDAYAEMNQKIDDHKPFVSWDEASHREIPHQPGVVSIAETTGEVVGRGEPNRTDVTATIKLLDVQPEIIHFKRNLNVKALRIWADTRGYGAEIDHYDINDQLLDDSIIGARVNNHYAKMTFEMTGYFTSTFKPNGEISKTLLGDPSWLQTDRVWDASLLGDLGGVIGVSGGLGAGLSGAFKGLTSLMWQVVGIAALGIGVYAMFKFAPVLIKRKARSIE